MKCFVKNIFVCFLLVAVVSCQKEVIIDTRKPLVVVGDTCLYDSDVALVYATHSHGDDSIAFVEDYVRRWAVEMLFYKKALQNVQTDGEIDRMVEIYRKNLILNEYQDGLINQQLAFNVSEADVQTFYEENKDLFILDETMIKGFYFIKEGRVPKMNEVRTWCKRKEQEDLENLEKYCVANNAVCEFFLEEWVSFDEFARKVPLSAEQLHERLVGNMAIEFKEKKTTCFVTADTILKKGDVKPLEMVAQEVRELLVNSKKAEFIKERKSALYEEALRNGYLRINM